MSYSKKAVENTLVKIWVFKNKYLIRQRGARVLMYHSIDDVIPDDFQGRYTISAEKFKEQMQLLKILGNPLKPLSYPLMTNSISITFDDGYKNNLAIAYPILKSLNIPFTIFICTNNLNDKSGLFLTRSDVQYLLQDPLVTIGSHGVSHSPMVLLSENKLMYELTKSKQILEDLISKPIDGISYPHGSYDSRVIKATKLAGFKWAVNSRFGKIFPQTSPYQLSRTDVWSWDTSIEFEHKLWGGHDWRGLLKI